MAAAPPAPEWEQTAHAFARHLRQHFDERGRDPASSATASTIRTNTELVPKRAENLLAWLKDLGGVPSVAGTQILEMGCGFGALASYLAVRHDPARLVAADVSDSYLQVGHRVARELGIDNLEFINADMRRLDAVADETFDVTILNNAFIYLPTRHDADAALRELLRTLKPGGTIVFHHANKWQWREPFTKDPIMHLLPLTFARLASAITGWSHNHGRVRLLSPPQLRRQADHVGLTTVAVADASGRNAGLKRYFSHYYVLVAKKPSR